MPEQVVDLLEAVEIKTKQRRDFAPTPGPPSISWSSFMLKLERFGNPVSASWCARKADVLLGFLARPQIPYGDRMLLLPANSNRTQDELDRNDRSVRLAQLGFDRLIGPAEKLEPRGFVREVLVEPYADASDWPPWQGSRSCC